MRGNRRSSEPTTSVLWKDNFDHTASSLNCAGVSMGSAWRIAGMLERFGDANELDWIPGSKLGALL